jgi:NAD(P)-dependent dehydrogenase (short-subunit alcohol dehydrogenase family)
MHSPGTALVTGAASGIGRCFAETLAGRGTELFLLDLDAGGLSETAERVARRQGRATTACADVADREQLGALIERLLPADRGLDLLINCAAILGAGIWAAQPPAMFEQTIRVNLIGTVNIIRAAMPALQRGRGQVVVLASTAALHGWPHLAAYSAAKFGVAGFTDAIRPELRRHGVGVTAVFPLLIDTPLLSTPDTPPILRRGRRIPPQAVVDKTLRAVQRRTPRVYVPGIARLVALLHALTPSLLDRYGERFGLE